MGLPELVYLAPSPFSHRARWALDAAGINYSISPYPTLPLYLAELPLRWRIGNLTGKITAPVLIITDDHGKQEVMMDSTEIAQWADKHKSSSRNCSLFPDGSIAEFQQILATVDKLSSLMRKGLVTAGLNNPAIADALFLPAGVTGFPAMVARNMLRRSFWKLESKYGAEDSTAELGKVLSELKAIQQQLNSNPNKLLLPQSTTPSYADIALATGMNRVARWSAKPLSANDSDAAAVGDAALGAAVQQTVGDVVPEFQAILRECAGLVRWSSELAEQHWPAAAEVYKQ